MNDGLSFGVGFWLIFGAGAVVGLVLAHHRQVITWIEGALSGHRPPPPQLPESPRHLRIVRGAPSPLPHRDDCGLHRWEGGDDGAA